MQSLVELMHKSKPVVAPAVQDGVSALLVKELEFPAAYIGSWATSATRYGLPDLGYITLSDMVDQVRRAREILDIPLIVDAEGGWGNPLHVARTVKALERAGANAVHLEDHEFGKHTGGKPRVLSTAATVDKIKAAMDARDSEDFVVIARSDALRTEGLDATIDRVLAFQDAGADAIFLSSVYLEKSTAERLVQEATVPLVVVKDPGFTVAEHASRGAAMVLDFGVTTLAAAKAMRAALTQLKNDEPATQESPDDSLAETAEFDRFLGIQSHLDLIKKYGLIEH
ncbi:isocitrate lyase/PEP mutase family protein [Paenarthrobacter aurescens]|uniref:isocitrate lyase/PEP mutase family protein n=1 Tax=Paenarthrobacter aurescens TaxID=43663 RepID=UPI0035EC3679